MTELSPAARAVLKACGTTTLPSALNVVIWRTAAAAIRALADHTPAGIRLGEPIDHWNPDTRTRRELRILANELDRLHQ